jgi:hypothetical protein
LIFPNRPRPLSRRAINAKQSLTSHQRRPGFVAGGRRHRPPSGLCEENHSSLTGMTYVTVHITPLRH